MQVRLAERPMSVAVNIIDDGGIPAGEFPVTGREAIVLSAAVTGEELTLAHRYPAEALRIADTELHGAVIAATTIGWLGSGSIIEPDPTASAQNYVFNIQGRPPLRRSFLEAPKAPTSVGSEEKDDAVRVSPSDLFNDDYEAGMPPIDAAAELQNTAAEIAMHARLSEEGRRVIVSDELFAEVVSPAISVRTAQITVRALKSQMDHLSDPALKQEVAEIEYKLESALAVAPIPLRHRIGEWTRALRGVAHVAGLVAVASAAKISH